MSSSSEIKYPCDKKCTVRLGSNGHVWLIFDEPSGNGQTIWSFGKGQMSRETVGEKFEDMLIDLYRGES